MTSCTLCHNTVEPARQDLGLELCFSCANTNVKKVRGDMNYAHKTAPTLMVMSPETHANYRRYVPYGKYTGRGSGTHKMSKPLATLK
jgi:hypothetical protein